MKRAILSLLFSFSLSYSVEIEQSTVTIITGDGIEAQIPIELAKQCAVIKKVRAFARKYGNTDSCAVASAAADCAASTADDESEIKISLPNILFDLLPTLTAALKCSYLLQQPEINTTARIQALESFSELVNTPAKLYELTTAANYLAALDLLNLCFYEWSEKQYSPTSTGMPTEIPLELDIAIAQRMRFSRQLIDDVAQGIADTLTTASLLVKTLEPECESIWCNALGPDNGLIACGHSNEHGNSKITIYNPETDEFTYILTPHDSVSMVQFNPTDTLEIWSSGEDGTIRVWNAYNGRAIRSYQSDQCHGFVFRHIPKHQLLVADGVEGQGLCVWDLSHDHTRTPTFLYGHDDDNQPVLAIETACDNSQFVSGTADGCVCIWDAETKRLLKKYNHDSGVMAVNLSHTKKLLACGLANGTVVLRDCLTDQEIFSESEHTDGIWSVLFGTEDDSLLCSGGKDHLIKLWDLRTRRPILTLDDHTNDIHYMTVNPEAQLLYSASHDNTVKVWDLKRLTQPVEALRREFSRNLTIDQLLMLQEAHHSTAPYPINTPKRRQLFDRSSPQARALLARNLGIELPEENQ